MNRKLKSVIGAGVVVLGGLGLSQTSFASSTPAAPVVAAPVMSTQSQTPLSLHAQPPYRAYDSRDPQFNPTMRKIVPGFALTVCGPQNAQALVVNITATEADGKGFLTAFPANGVPSGTSIVNFVPGVDSPNGGIISTDNQGCIRVQPFVNATHVLVDITGYFAA